MISSLYDISSLYMYNSISRLNISQPKYLQTSFVKCAKIVCEKLATHGSPVYKTVLSTTYAYATQCHIFSIVLLIC